MKKIIIGKRIPKDFFIASGVGESNITIHAGSYHLALKDAGIENCNIINYSSILPKIARKIEKPNNLEHGSVMETISAVSSCKKGSRATASIIIGWLYDKKTNEKYGGLVCEYNGNKTIKEAEKELKKSLREIYENGFSDDFELKDIETHSKTIKPRKKYGTAIVAICFLNYEVPIIEG